VGVPGLSEIKVGRLGPCGLPGSVTYGCAIFVAYNYGKKLKQL